MLEICLTLVLAVHLMCVNVASAGPLVCLWLEWQEARQVDLAGRVGRFLAWASVVTLVAGGLLGLVVGSLVWDDQYGEVLRRFPDRIHYGLWEFAFSLLLMVLHAWWWGRQADLPVVRRTARTLLPLLSGTNLIYHFPFLFVIISDVSSGFVGPEVTFRQLIVDGSVASRVVHFVMAAFAVTGVMLISWTLWASPRLLAEQERARVAVWGARLALVPTLLQLPIGVWVLFQLPSTAQQRLLGGDLVGASLLAISVAAALWLMEQLVAVAAGETNRAALIRLAVSMLVVVVLMTGVLQRIS